MSSEHNPIAVLISQIQSKWTKQASTVPQYPVVRWVIRPDHARLFEGFLRLEGTKHGSIPEVVITMLTPFENKKTFSRLLINDWCKAYLNDSKTQGKLSTDQKSKWDAESFEINNTGEEEHTDRLISTLESFQKKMVGNDITLVLALFPHSVREMGEYNVWINQLLKRSVPPNIRFMIFDHVGQEYFSYAVNQNPDKIFTLVCEPDLDGAIAKIAKMGNPNAPEVKFRECMLEMGKGIQKKNKEHVHEWGKKGLQVMQKSGSKSMFATAHIVYAGMLFNFKQYEVIDQLLVEGLALAKQGLNTEEAACRPLIVQHYGFIGSSMQLQKRLREAMNAYESQAINAVGFGLAALSLTPFQQAYTLSKRYDTQKYDALIVQAYETGRALSKEELVNSNFSNIAIEYLQWLEMKRRSDDLLVTELELNETLGIGWKDFAKTGNKMSPLENRHSLTLS